MAMAVPVRRRDWFTRNRTIITWSMVLAIQLLFFAGIFGTKGFTTAHNKNWLDSLVVLVFLPHGLIGGTLGEQVPFGFPARSFWVYTLVFVGAVPASWLYARGVMGTVWLIALIGSKRKRAAASDREPADAGHGK